MSALAVLDYPLTLLRLRSSSRGEPHFIRIDSVDYADRSRAKRILNLDIEYPPRAESYVPPVPAILCELNESSLLDADREANLFRLMNHLKHRADGLRHKVDLQFPSSTLMNEIERLLDHAQQIRNRLVMVFLKLANSVARGFVGPGFPFDELVSEGHATLLRAVDKFDPDRGFRFSTYATHAVRRNLCRFVTRRRKERERAMSVEDPSLLPDDRRWTWTYQNQMNSANAALINMLNTLPSRERAIVQSRFALGDQLKPQTLQSIADKLGVSRERVRQLERRALAKLRHLALDSQLRLPA